MSKKMPKLFLNVLTIFYQTGFETSHFLALNFQRFRIAWRNSFRPFLDDITRPFDERVKGYHELEWKGSFERNKSSISNYVGNTIFKTSGEKFDDDRSTLSTVRKERKTIPEEGHFKSFETFPFLGIEHRRPLTRGRNDLMNFIISPVKRYKLRNEVNKRQILSKLNLFPKKFKLKKIKLNLENMKVQYNAK